MDILYNKKVQVVAKLVTFTVLVLWVLVWVYVGLVLGTDWVLDMLEQYGEIQEESWLWYAIAVWWAITGALVGAWVTKKAFGVVLHKERVEDVEGQ